ncbi:hypothetical protein [Glaciecola petra]|uniref:Uncharacterized protein n=1 Tax=Glaciecola petra TaxID=3075602 RepID=A0ABU2ZM33_9ALTE|nr:hypothetical protein [Aestuariibacter sp. P117]MDT0593680.1 hypothetical protein [Aestuariibacter sp. P117]
MKHYFSELEHQLVYQFNSHADANRFVNELKHWSLHEVKAKLHRASNNVIVKYSFDGKGFDYTSSDLDDLAARYGGHEDSL